MRFAQAGDCSIKQAEFHLKRQDHANKRFLAAIKTLAVVRKLALPALQVTSPTTNSTLLTKSRLAMNAPRSVLGAAFAAGVESGQSN